MPELLVPVSGQEAWRGNVAVPRPHAEIKTGADSNEIRGGRNTIGARMMQVALRMCAGLMVLVVVGCGSGSADGTATSPPDTGDRYAFASSAAEVYADCMEERGFAVTLDGRGGSAFSAPPGQEEQGFRADEECSSAASESQGPARIPTDDELRERYKFLLGVRDCLEGHGYSPPDPPSIDGFVDSFGANWIPYFGVAPRDEAEWTRINDLCPQF